MFLTETDLINARIKQGRMLNDSEIIKNIIHDDLNSQMKKKIFDGENYYKCNHDINKKEFRISNVIDTKINENGLEDEFINTFSNPNRSNHHNVNAFHKILVDQKASYIFGKEPTITIKGAETDNELKEYENVITDFTDEQFSEAFQNCIVGASNCGFCAVHIYYDENDKFNYCVIPARELILIYDTEYQKELKEVIRYYDIETFINGEKYLRKKVEWWTNEDVTYFIQDEKNDYQIDLSAQENPKPHWYNVFWTNDIETRKEAHSWGRVPFIVLKNNSYASSDLEPIKNLIDAYDLISSECTNNILDLVDLYWVISGFGGENTSAIIKKLQINKAVNVLGGADGNIEAKQVDLSVESRKSWLEMLRRDIYHFGQGIDLDTSKFGTAPSGVSLKFQYSNLDLKADNMILKLKKAIKEFFWFYTQFINYTQNKSYDSSLIKVDINKSQIMNELEAIQEIQSSVGIVSNKTLLARHPFVNDVNEELKLLDEESKNEIQEYENKINSNKVGDYSEE